jgi:hypothetical protein
MRRRIHPRRAGADQHPLDRFVRQWEKFANDLNDEIHWAESHFAFMPLWSLPDGYADGGRYVTRLHDASYMVVKKFGSLAPIALRGSRQIMYLTQESRRYFAHRFVTKALRLIRVTTLPGEKIFESAKVVEIFRCAFARWPSVRSLQDRLYGHAGKRLEEGRFVDDEEATERAKELEEADRFAALELNDKLRTIRAIKTTMQEIASL